MPVIEIFQQTKTVTLESASGKFYIYTDSIRLSSMSRTQSAASKTNPGLQLFSDMMLMRFKPKSTEGAKKAMESSSIRERILGEEQSGKPVEEQNKIIMQKLDRILYLQMASRDTVILGNYNQLDMIDLDGLTSSFVDTFHYWSFSPNSPIMDLKVNSKKQLMLIYSLKNLFLYAYDAMKKEKTFPQFVGSIQLKDDIIFMQFATPDIIAIFYSSYFEIYSVNDSNIIQKKLEKKYNIEALQFKIFAVPQAIDSTINIFFEENHKKAKTFGLWCIEVNLFSQNIKQNPPYKIYDIMNNLKPLLRIENYSKDIIFLNLGQEILLASKGYIVDSVNINIQVENTSLRLFPQRNILLHIQANFVEIYNFKLNLTVNPHRIELTSLDSCEISNFKENNRLLMVLPIFQSNFVLFYEDNERVTTNGEIFYKFMVSYTVKIQEKINRILHSDIPLSDLDEVKMERKCDILRKIGLEDEDIYLQVWKRSNKSSVSDFQFLLSTQNYKKIKEEIQNKMRKTSMKFKEVLKIEESCLQILSDKIAKDSCSKENLKDYLTCHLLIRKLRLFKELAMLHESEQILREDKGFYINIQEYYNLKKIELKQLVLQKISYFLSSRKGGAIVQIRTILNHFRFVYRLIYSDLLEEIIKLAKNDLIEVIKAVPQLLPMASDEDRELGALELGVWGQISQHEWDRSLYFQKIVTINNKEVLEDLIKDVWFKRNYLTVHDFISLSNKDIQFQNEEQNSVDIFYFFIEKVFKTIKQEQTLRAILHHLECHYKKFPQHLRNRVLLHTKLYQYHQENREAIKYPSIAFSKFLTLKDYDIFKLLFEYQKVKKNCILKQIQPLYEKTSEDGRQMFNLSLLNYFTSEVSEVSHLKYLLNRVNNQKKEFHSAHESMYGVLVKAMQMKLKLGSPKDIPIDEVLIYLQNIPITSNNNRQIINDLETIQKISEESQIFKKMKINMTIREIIDNYELVMEKLVDYEMEKYKIMTAETDSLFLTSTYRLLAEIQSLKKNVYGQENELAFFIYLTKLMERQDKIAMTNFLLTDQYINNYFYIDISIIENIVQYMYKWKFSENSSFQANQQYIHTLLDLLPDDNYLKRFIEEELKFAIKLSSLKEPIRYPLATERLYPRIQELQDIIKYMDNETLCSIDIEEIITIMKRLKDLSKHIPTSSHIKGSHFQVIQSTIKISIVEPQADEIKDQAVYEEFIKTYITKGLIKEVLPLIRKSINLSKKYDVITILILIHNIIYELNEESRIAIIKIISYLYEQPLQLLEIIQKLLNTSFTGLESTQFLKEEYNKVRDLYLNYNPENIIFNRPFLHIEEETGPSKKILIKNTLIKLKRVRPEFIHDFLYDFLYIILCFEPHNMAIFLKFVGASKYKLIRSFFSHLIIEEIFDEMNVLQLMKRAFYLLLKSLKENTDIYQLVKKYKQLSLVEEFDLKKYPFLTDFEKKVVKNYTAFETKKNKIKQFSKTHRFKKFLVFDKEVSIKKSIKNPQTIKDREPHQYVFSDSDDDYIDKEEVSEEAAPNLIQKPSKQSKIVFDRSRERRDFYKIAPIKSREELGTSQADPNNDFNTSKHANESHPLNPIEDLRGSKNRIRKYFSRDVRSGYGDGEEEYMNDSMTKEELLPPSDQKLRKKSFDMRASNPNRMNESCRQGNLNKTNQINHQIKISKPTKPLKLRSVQSAEMEPMDDRFSFENEPLQDLQLQNRKSEEEKSQQDVNIKAITSQQQFAKPNQEVLEDVANDLLEKVYKTYSPRLEAEPYSLKALLSYRSQNKEEFAKVLALAIEQIYQKPNESVQIALRLLLQIGQKFTESDVNVPFAEIFQKIAKLQAKYGLQLPIQKMLPLSSLLVKSTSADELFQSLKTSVNSVCDNENIFKIAKLLSIGFKRSALEEQIIAFYLQKQVTKLNREKNDEGMVVEMEKIRGLVTKLQVRILLEINDHLIKKATNSDLKKRLVQIFTEAIRVKVNAKEAREFAARHK